MKTTRFFGTFLLCALSALLLAAPHLHGAAGDLDTLNVNIPGGTVYATAVQPDGKILVAGTFSIIGGQVRYGIARLNTNGTVDTSFNANLVSSQGYDVNCVAVQPDGKILIGGTFRQNPNAAQNNINLSRLNADGSLDSSFFPSGGGTDGTVFCLAVQADGRILIGGAFTTVTGRDGSFTRNRIARLAADGTVDMGFDPNANSLVNSVAVQPDGRILVGGNFSNIGGTARSFLARLAANGTLDTSFNPNPGNVVYSVAVQADGRILLAGFFTSVGGMTRNRIARVNADGTLDLGFDPNANNVVHSLTVQADGQIMLGGTFTSVGGVTTRNRIARINANGTLDGGFDPNANGIVHNVGLQADGQVLLGGAFTTLQPNGAGAATGRTRLARLLNVAATQTLTVPDTAHILWTRGGSTPGLVRATFELSTDGGATWGAPIAATRIGITANWQASGGFALPTSGQLRARGVTTAGYYSGSAGLIEQVVSFSGLANAPEIVVTGNGVSIPDGDTTPGTTDGTDLGPAALGATTAVRTFTIINSGTAALNLTGTPKVAVSGTNAADFVVTVQPTSPVAPSNGTSTFEVTFTPGAAGVRSATLSIANNDADEGSFDFAVSARGLSFTTDTDSDGLNDAAELMGAALGFNWQVSQTSLVQTYYGMANGAGLYTGAQVQALNVGTPLISRDVTTGKFKLTLGLTKTTTLSPTNWLAFPFTAPATTINGQGKIEFEFTVPDNAAFFRIEAP